MMLVRALHRAGLDLEFSGGSVGGWGSDGFERDQCNHMRRKIERLDPEHSSWWVAS